MISLLEDLNNINLIKDLNKKKKSINSIRNKIDFLINKKNLGFVYKYSKSTNNSLIDKLKLGKPYIYKELEVYENKLKKLYDEQNEIFKKEKNIKQKKKNLESLRYTRVISELSSKNKNFKHKITNAYVKLWEIYTEIPELFNKTDCNIFHVAEAPGNWIKCTENYINKLNENRNNKLYSYQWYANTLNPINKKNIDMFGKIIIDDTYGLINRNKEKWIYGKDDTGDITVVNNLIWFRNYFKKNKFNVNIVTGDGGIGDTNIELSFIQKLDFAQTLCAITVLEKGGNCVFKHFSYYNRYYKNSKEGSGFMVSFLYLYYILFDKIICIKPKSSNPRSGEYYLVGLGFKGITESNLIKLHKSLNNFEVNNTLFDKKDIPIEFQKVALNFIIKLYKYNISEINISNLFFSCFTNKYKKLNNIIKCQYYFNKNSIVKRKTHNYKKWNSAYKLYNYENLTKKKNSKKTKLTKKKKISNTKKK